MSSEKYHIQGATMILNNLIILKFLTYFIMDSIKQQLSKQALNIFTEYETLIMIVYDYVLYHFPKKYAFNTKKQKYNAILIITELIYLNKTGISYENYRGPVNAKTLNKHSLFFAEYTIFKNVYALMHVEYSKYNSFSKFKYQSTDTSYIMNINGKEGLGRNTHFKNKNCYKISMIVDSNRIPHSTIITAGNHNDAKIGLTNIDTINEYINIKNGIHKPYLLADKMYDTNDFRNECIEVGYKPIIDYNKRNTKNKKLIKKLTKKQRKTYKKRIKVENTFCIIKKYKRIRFIYDSYLSTYTSFLYLAECCMIRKYLVKPKIRYHIESQYINI